MFVIKMNLINILIVERPDSTQPYISVGLQPAHLIAGLAKLLEVYSNVRRGDYIETGIVPLQDLSSLKWIILPLYKIWGSPLCAPKISGEVCMSFV